MNRQKGVPLMMWDALHVSGASSRDRTGDLILTMDALYLLSYRGGYITERIITQLCLSNNKHSANGQII